MSLTPLPCSTPASRSFRRCWGLTLTQRASERSLEARPSGPTLTHAQAEALPRGHVPGLSTTPTDNSGFLRL